MTSRIGGLRSGGSGRAREVCTFSPPKRPGGGEPEERILRGGRARTGLCTGGRGRRTNPRGGGGGQSRWRGYRRGRRGRSCRLGSGRRGSGRSRGRPRRGDGDLTCSPTGDGLSGQVATEGVGTARVLTPPRRSIHQGVAAGATPSAWWPTTTPLGPSNPRSRAPSGCAFTGG